MPDSYPCVSSAAWYLFATEAVNPFFEQWDPGARNAEIRALFSDLEPTVVPPVLENLHGFNRITVGSTYRIGKGRGDHRSIVRLERKGERALMRFDFNFSLDENGEESTRDTAWRRFDRRFVAPRRISTKGYRSIEIRFRGDGSRNQWRVIERKGKEEYRSAAVAMDRPTWRTIHIPLAMKNLTGFSFLLEGGDRGGSSLLVESIRLSRTAPDRPAAFLSASMPVRRWRLLTGFESDKVWKRGSVRTDGAAAVDWEAPGPRSWYVTPQDPDYDADWVRFGQQSFRIAWSPARGDWRPLPSFPERSPKSTLGARRWICRDTGN